jgi:hypothetical protein
MGERGESTGRLGPCRKPEDKGGGDSGLGWRRVACIARDSWGRIRW